jgi:hypothetical protein
MSVKRYTKRPVTIEAMQFDGTNDWETVCWIRDNGGEAELLFAAERITIETLEGTMFAIPGDFIIKGIKGEFYPCKPDIFEMTYTEAARVDCFSNDTCKCIYGLGGACKCEHSDDMHDDCSSGIIHCHVKIK